ncbi:MAG TPA: dihydroorotate dehydrogenase [Acidimicrobiales bacterium]
MVDQPEPDLATRVGSIVLPNPLMTASGTAGHGAELAGYVDLAALGAVVVKSLSAEPWAGNPAPRLHEATAGMVNSVGLQGPGVEAWLEHELPALARTGARVVASIWGHTVDDFARAAAMLAGAPAAVIAVEVNVSCPNLEDRRRMFAHSASATQEAVDATKACGLPRWAKLSPNVHDIVEIADAAARGGAEAVTLVNTLLAIAIDAETRRPVLGAVRGGLSGPAMKPVALRAVYDCHEALPDLPVIGVGGVTSAPDVVEFLLAGACAVQVGTASFADPRTLDRLRVELAQWCWQHGVRSITELIGGAHG